MTTTKLGPAQSPRAGSARAPRVALYGHDTMGLGHLRRNLALAGAVTGGAARPDVLVLTGTLEAGRFSLPDRADLVTLPGVAKDADGSYRTRRLGLDLDSTVRVRSAVLEAALTSFDPDLLVVDKVALGFEGELGPALARLRGRGTHLVLGLRDVLDAPPAARRDWRRQRTTEALRRYYDEVWVYGDQRIVDIAEECRIPPGVRHLVRYTGYLADGRSSADPPAGLDPHDKYVLCLLGGGQDGAELAETFSATELPDGLHGILLAGPYLPEGTIERAQQRAETNPALRVVPFAADSAGWISNARAVVCMGGYNTVSEVLATETPALMAPRTTPRAEQQHRVRRLAELGHLDQMSAADLTPATLGRWLHEAVHRPRRRRVGLNLEGLATVRNRVDGLLAARLTEGARHAS